MPENAPIWVGSQMFAELKDKLKFVVCANPAGNLSTGQGVPLLFSQVSSDLRLKGQDAGRSLLPRLDAGLMVGIYPDKAGIKANSPFIKCDQTSKGTVRDFL